MEIKQAEKYILVLSRRSRIRKNRIRVNINCKNTEKNVAARIQKGIARYKQQDTRKEIKKKNRKKLK